MRITCTLALAALLAPPLAAQGDDVDSYPILLKLNQAQLVMLTETGLLPRAFARDMARGIQRVVEASSKPGGRRSSGYLEFEKQLIEVVGPDASKLHMGRSNIDIGATTERMVLRDELLAVFEELAAARERLLELAAKNVETIIPGYTHAVQAQPTSLGHYLSAHAEALERDADRLRSAYGRLNQSPLGSAAFGTSGFPLKRERLAELLGFPVLIENSFDATGLGTMDSKAEVAAALAISALTLGRFAQDLVIQYGDPSPGLMLADKLTGRSSIMPQKRNPGVIERLRYTSSAVVGDAQTVWIVSHNTPVGDVADVRGNLMNRAVLVTAGARKMYAALREIAGGLVVRPERTLAEVDADYSTMTELADTLQREAGVPFRVGHEFASELTTYGRTNGKRPKDLTYGEATEIYRKATGQKLPLTEAQFRQAIDARYMVFNRKGRGGPQPPEVRRMLSAQQQRVAGDQSWVKGEKGRLTAAYANLEREFKTLSEENR